MLLLNPAVECEDGCGIVRHPMVRPGSEVEVGHSQRTLRATSRLQGRMHTIDAKYLEIQLTKNIDLLSITNDYLGIYFTIKVRRLVVDAHTDMHAHEYAHMHTCTCARNTHTHIHTHTHTHTHTHSHTHTPTHTPLETGTWSCPPPSS